MFKLADGSRLTTPYDDWYELGPADDDQRTRLALYDRFIYVFVSG